MPYQMMYSSKAVRPMSQAELQDILVDARGGNDARGIGGVLVYNDGVFLQILEGEREVVESLMRAIAADSRHTQVKVFHAAEVEKRSFRSWHMAFLSASTEDLAGWTSLPGTVGIDRLVRHVEEDAANLPKILLSIVKALAEQGPSATGAG